MPRPPKPSPRTEPLSSSPTCGWDPTEHANGPAFPADYGTMRGRTADEAVRRIQAAGGRAVCLEADLAGPAVPRQLFDRAEAALGPVEILVNNASGWLANTFLPSSKDRFGRILRQVDTERHDRQFAVDARAPALLIAEFARRHIGRGATSGRIIGLTSGGSGGFPITANMLYPPVTDTGWITPAVAQDAAAGPLRHVAQPGEVAEVITFLASHQARYVTGQIIRMS